MLTTKGRPGYGGDVGSGCGSRDWRVRQTELVRGYLASHLLFWGRGGGLVLTFMGQLKW
jgi:hypothetical protein